MTRAPALPRQPASNQAARDWPSVVAFYQRGAVHGPAIAAMARLVEQIAASPLAAALHPSTSHYLLRLFASNPFHHMDDQIHIEHDGEAFEVRYRGAPKAQPHSVTPITSHWSKRGPDGMALLRRCLHHLAWVVEEHPTNA
jgi:hypothetical protein